MVLKIFISFNHAFHPGPVHILKCASKYILVDPYPGFITWQFSPAIGENPLPLYEGATRRLNLAENYYKSAERLILPKKCWLV